MTKSNKQKRLNYLLNNLVDNPFDLGIEKDYIIDVITTEKLGNLDEELYHIEAKYSDYDLNLYEEQKRDLEKKFQDYEKELSSYTNEKLCELFIEVEFPLRNKYELMKLKEKEFSFWNKRSGWTVKEFLALKFSIKPKEFDLDTIKHLEYSIATEETLDIAVHYYEIYELVRNAIDCKDLVVIKYSMVEENELIKRIDWLNWCKINDIELPKELIEGNNLSKDNLINKTQALEELERKSLLKMIYGMAIGGYGWNPDSKKSSTVKEITDDITRNIAKPITDDTVRKWLKESKQLASVLESED